MLVFPRLARFSPCQLQTCFDTATILGIVEIEVRALHGRLNSASYSIVMGRGRKPGSTPKASSLVVASCVCTLSEEHTRMAAFFMKRPALPHADGVIVPLHFPVGHTFDFEHQNTLRLYGARRRNAVPSMKAVRCLPPVAPAIVAPPAKEVAYQPTSPTFPVSDGLPALPDAFQCVWDPSSIPVEYPLFTPPASPKPALALTPPDTRLFAVEAAPPPHSVDALDFSYDIPRDFIDTLDHLRRLEEAQAKTLQRLNDAVAAAAAKGIILSFSFKK